MDQQDVNEYQGVDFIPIIRDEADECSTEDFEKTIPVLNDISVEDEIVILGIAGEFKSSDYKNSKTWGKNSLQDPTNSGIGEKIMNLITNEPPKREWKKHKDWISELSLLYIEYNENVGFKAFGEEFNEE